MGLRVVLDTNVLISHLLSKRDDSVPDRIINAAVRGTFTLIVSDELLSELVSKAKNKPYLARRIDKADLDDLLVILTGIAEEADLSNVVYPNVVRDPADDFLVALATAGRADVLVTGDNDLLDLDLPTSFRIMTLTDFITEIEAG